jgi:hypothetical protein
MADKNFHPVVQYGFIILASLSIIWIGTMEIKNRHQRKVRAGQVGEPRTSDVLFLSSVIGTNEKLVRRTLDRQVDKDEPTLRIARGRLAVPLQYPEEGPGFLSSQDRSEMRAMFGGGPAK